MSKQFLTIVIALLVVFGGFMTALFHAQGKIIDRMLPVQGPCVSAPYAVGERPSCVVVEA